jgi:hypothetical protein
MMQQIKSQKQQLIAMIRMSILLKGSALLSEGLDARDEIMLRMNLLSKSWFWINQLYLKHSKMF